MKTHKTIVTKPKFLAQAIGIDSLKLINEKQQVILKNGTIAAAAASAAFVLDDEFLKSGSVANNFSLRGIILPTIL